jgi:hypothetical protein
MAHPIQITSDKATRCTGCKGELGGTSSQPKTKARLTGLAADRS